MQEQAKEKIKALVEKYELVRNSGKLKSYTEEETKKDLILPLLEALGWNVFDKNEVSAEEQISGDRVDYGVYLNGRVKFYLEAKKLSADLHREDFANQSIKYSWNKGATWAVLTDFESLKVFNAQEIDKSLADKLLFEIPFTQYFERFDEQLSLLSKEAFEKGLIDKYAEDHGKKLQKISVSALLYKDLQKARDILTKSLAAWNEKVPKDLLDEGVQKLLDRLIFLRVAEDRGVEPPTLIPMIRQWQARRKQESIYKSMIKKFREFDKIYNSNLFSPHPFEDWEEYDNATEKVVNILYGKKGYYEYDFKAMPADVLGTVYENYLGYRLLQSKKGMTVDKDAKKRKEQGIYYTPTFVVDYIVKNALGPVLAECKSIADLKKIKVLDPACGSGSFLVKALEAINDKYKDFGADGGVYTKLQILTENIYGVDLDEQAVEIARLNLLINALDSKIKLPSLARNIKNGNSLISGTDEELKKYFGKNFRDKKPFNWQEEFPEVFAQGGFDVIIGNPPYVRNRDLEEKDKEFFPKGFYSASGQYDLYQLFFEQSINLLKENGLLGFITSNKYAIADYGKKLREFILDNTKIKTVVDVSNLLVFKEASTYPYIIILQRTKDNRGNLIKGYKVDNELKLENAEVQINQDDIKNSETKNFVLKKDLEFLKNIENKSIKLGEIATIKETIHTGNVRNKLVIDSKIDENCKKLLAGKDCHRYWFKWNGKYIRYDKSLIDKKKGEYGNLCEEKYFDNSKILLRDISKYPEAVFDDEKYYSVNTLYSIQSVEKYRLLYLLAIINSGLIKFIFNQKFEDAHVAGGFLRFKKIYTSQIPIYKIDFTNRKEKSLHDGLAKLAEKMTKLNKELQETPENSNKWNSIKEEIAKTDKIIDQKVYELYGLREEEIRIIENIK